MAKTITQLPPATTVTATTVLPADNAAATATEKVTVAQIVGLAPVQAVAGRTGNVALAVADIGGLQTALDGKQPTGSYLTAVPDGSVTDAKVAAPGLSGAAINWVAIVEWQPNTSYAKGALVAFRGAAYRRSAAGSSGPSFVLADWQQVTPTVNVVASPTALSTNQNDYALPTGDIIRLAATTAVTITGIIAGYDGQAELLINVGSSAITLAHASTGSAAANRLAVQWAGNYVLDANGGSALLVYDATSQVWRVV